ncbi:MAG: ABC transporter substrate-binding protein [Proteobacteria bacterium]|nr:ABC transporter substrate-binding protein [Pseudomonadota bacterium]
MPHRLALLFAALLLAAAPARAAEPQAVVEGFHNVLSEVMQNAEKLGITGRYERLRPAVEQAFDLPRMIRIASGSAWKSASESARDALIDAFARMSAGTYASQFKGYSGERFEIDEERPGPRESRLVATRIVKGNGDSVPITYVLVRGETPGNWRIADVLLNNAISELSVRRSEYRAIIERGGVDGLVDTLNDKVNQLLKP